MLAIQTLSDHIGKRLSEFVQAWEIEDNSEFLSYLRTKSRFANQHGEGSAMLNRPPFWCHLPGWLAIHWTQDSGDEVMHQEFIQDVMWAQYCLFFFIRIQDDVYDGQITNPAFLFDGNRFLVETERILARYFRVSDDLWLIYHHLLDQTSMGIIEGNKQQTSDQTPPEKILQSYKDAGAIFNLGAAAVCCKCNRMDIYPKITEFTADMTVSGQIMDDIADIQEDLENEKYNFAANILLRQGNQQEISFENADDVIGRNILYYGMDEILHTVQVRLSHAGQIMRSIKIPEAARLIQSYQRGIVQMKDALRQSRVGTIFGNYNKFDF